MEAIVESLGTAVIVLGLACTILVSLWAAVWIGTCMDHMGAPDDE